MTNKQRSVWVCNECNASNFTGNVREDDLEWLACDSCGCDEFHEELCDDGGTRLCTQETRKAHDYWIVENNGWFDEFSWFNDGARFETKDIAVEHAEKRKAMNDGGTKWRVTRVAMEHYEI